MVTETAQSAGVLGSLGVDAKLFLAQLVNFAIVLLVMWRWVYRPLVRMLDERSKKIERGLKDADAAAAAKHSAEEEKTRLIDEARLKAKDLVEAAAASAEKEREEMMRRARAEVEKIVGQGKSQLRDEKEKMVAEVKAEAASLVIAAVDKIVGERLDPKKDEALIRDSLKKAAAEL